MRLIVALVIALCAFVSQAHAFGKAGGMISTTCPHLVRPATELCFNSYESYPGQGYYRSTADTDGTIYQVGQANNFPSQIYWNVPGVHFNVGIRKLTYCNGGTIPCSTRAGYTNLIDWASYFTNYGSKIPFDPAGTNCTSTSTFNVGSHRIECNAAPNTTVSLIGGDWTPVVSGTRICLGLQLDKTATGGTNNNVIFTDNFFELFQQNNGTIETTCAGIGSPWFEWWHFFNSQGAANSDPWNVTFDRNYVDMHGEQAWVHNSYNAANNTLTNGSGSNNFGMFSIQTSGAIENAWNFFQNTVSRAGNYYYQSGTYNQFGNVEHNGSYYPNYNHHEYKLASLTAANITTGTNSTINNLTWNDAAANAGNWTAPHDIGFNQNGTVIPLIDVERNVTVLNPPYRADRNANTYGYANNSVKTPSNGGTGYAVGDLVQATNNASCLAQGNVQPTFIVNTISGGQSTGPATQLTAWFGGLCSAPIASGTTNFTSLIGSGTGMQADISGASNQFLSSTNITITTGSGISVTATDINLKDNAMDDSAWAVSVIANITIGVTCTNKPTVTGNFSSVNGAASPIGPTGRKIALLGPGCP